MCKYLKVAAAVLLAVSCSVKEVPESAAPIEQYDRVYAAVEGVSESESKTYVDDQLRVLWHADDRISVFSKYTFNQEYQFTGQTGDNAGTFNKVESDVFVTGNSLPSIWAVYPYRESTKISNDAVLSVEFPATQSYAPGTFGRGAGVMVSATDDNRLLFRNAGGVLVFKLYGSGVSVKSLTLRGNKGEKLAGCASITMEVGGVPSASIVSDESETLTLDCSEPVAIGATADAFTEFWLLLPPTEFAEGFTVTVRGEGGSFEKSTSKPVSITRNHLSRMAPIEVVLTPDNAVDNLADALTAEDGAFVDFETLVYVSGSRAAIVTDGTHFLSVYGGAYGVACKAGDRIRVKGTKVTYRSKPEITDPQIEVLSSGNALAQLDYQDITGTFDSFSSDYPTPVMVTGVFKYMNSGYANNEIDIPGTDRNVYVYWPLAELFDPVDLNGKQVVIKGFYLFDHGNSRDIFPVSVEKAAEGGMPDNEIWYTSTDGQIVTPNKNDVFGANIVSNTYADGKGVISFDGPVTKVGDSAFRLNCASLQSIRLPDSVKQIEFGAFFRCTGLVTVDLPSSLESIGQDAFGDCYELTSVCIPESVTWISFYAFTGCKKMQSFTGKYATDDSRGLILDNGTMVAFAPAGCVSYTVPANVTRVYSGVFANCPSLGVLVYPETVTEVGQVYGCPALEAIVCKSATPPSFYTGTWLGEGFHAFPKTNECPIFVPSSSVNDYKQADKWSEYADRIQSIPNSIGAVQQNTPDNCPVSFQGLVCATGTRGFVVTDGSLFLLVYTLYVQCSVGDIVQVDGIKTTYRNNPEITSSGLTYSVLSSGNSLPEINYADITDTIDSATFPYACPVQLTGVLNGDVVNVEGASYHAEFYFPTANFDLSSLNGKKVLAKGLYLFDYNFSRDIMLTSLEEVSEPLTSEAVDLGLSVKWATFNVGATSPEGYGDYFAWAETETKSNYSWATYKWCNGDYNNLTKYCSQYSYGTVDGKKTIEPEDDAAKVKWGEPWRMPTNEEWDELYENCTWTWTAQNGTYGYMVTSNKTGFTDKSIFLPAAGNKSYDTVEAVGSTGFYWSSNTVSGMSIYAYYVELSSGSVGFNGLGRYFGFPVRPVCE